MGSLPILNLDFFRYAMLLVVFILPKNAIVFSEFLGRSSLENSKYQHSVSEPLPIPSRNTDHDLLHMRSSTNITDLTVEPAESSSAGIVDKMNSKKSMIVKPGSVIGNNRFMLMDLIASLYRVRILALFVFIGHSRSCEEKENFLVDVVHVQMNTREHTHIHMNTHTHT